MKSNTELLKIAEKYIGYGGTKFRKWAGLPSWAAYCQAFVCYIASEGGDSPLYYDGKRLTYCPTGIAWCRKNLAEIPLYLAMPMDIIYFDWDENNVPNHVGFVRKINDTESIYTVEGNTDGGIVANKKRAAKYVCGIYRPHFKGKFDTSKRLTVDGICGYNTIAALQKVLCIKVDGILGLGTVKSLQKFLGVAADGAWGAKTSKAFQKKLGVTADGEFGKESVTAMQKWLNKVNFTEVINPAPKPVAKTWTQETIGKALAWCKKICADPDYHYVNWNGTEAAKECPICHNHKRGSKYFGWNCIGFVAAAYHHGGGLKVKCANNGLAGGSQVYTEILRLAKQSPKKALAYWTKKVGVGKWEIIWNAGKNIPASMLKPGDIVIYFKGSKFWHIAIYYNKQKIADCTSSKKDSPSIRNYKLTYPCLIAFKLIGK